MLNYSFYRSSCPDVFFRRECFHRCFPVNFAKLLRTSFFTKHHWWLLLSLFLAFWCIMQMAKTVAAFLFLLRSNRQLFEQYCVNAFCIYISCHNYLTGTHIDWLCKIKKKNKKTLTTRPLK